MADFNLKTRRLPKAYHELEFIQSTGTQYIDTGFIATANTKVQAICQFTSVDTQVSGIWDTNGRCQFGIASGMFTIGIGSASISPTACDTNKHTFIIDVKNKKGYIDGSSYSLQSATVSMANDTMPIFVQKDYIHTPKFVNYCSMKLYEYKVWDNDILVRNFIPCKRKSDNVIGVYDLVTCTFFTNAGTGVFTAGNIIKTVDEVNIDNKDVVLIEMPRTDYDELSYIQSSGTQYIDTGVSFTTSNYVNSRLVVSQEVLSNASQIYFAAGSGKSGNDNRALFIGGFDDGKFYYGSGDNIQAGNGFQKGINYIYDLNFKNNSYTIKNSSTGQTVVTAQTVKTLQNNTTNIFLFGYSHITPSSQMFFPAKVYFAKIYDNDIIVRDLVPAKRKIDNAIGMWDKVEGKFYPNAGTGVFTGGSVVGSLYDIVWRKAPDIPSIYTRKNFIESTGTQYIDTGILASFSDNPKWTITAQETTTETSNKILIGNGNTGAPNFFGALSNGKWGVGTASSGFYANVNHTVKADITYNIDSTHCWGTVNNISYSRTASSTPSGNWTLFTGEASRSTEFNSHAKVWGATLTLNNVLVRDFVPVVRNTDNVAGMYDIVNDTFYTNAGTGSFVVG